MIKKRMLSFFILFLLIKSHSNLYGQNFDTIISKRINLNRFNGVVLVSSKDSIVYLNSHGCRDFLCKEKINDSSSFFLASVSKILTSFAIMKLVEEGKVSLRSPVDSILIDFPIKETTINDLINHTSGLQFRFIKFINNSKSYNNKDLYENFKKENHFITYNRKEQVDKIFDYSNFNYMLLALILEKIHKKHFDEIINDFNKDKDNILFQQIHFNDSFRSENFAYPLMQKNNTLKNVYDIEIERDERNAYKNLYGHSNISASILSINKLLSKFNKNEIVDTSLYNKERIESKRYFNGLSYFKIDNNLCLCHGGNITGYNHVACFIPKLNCNFIILQNIHYDNIVYENNEIVKELIKTFFSKKSE